MLSWQREAILRWGKDACDKGQAGEERDAVHDPAQHLASEGSLRMSDAGDAGWDRLRLLDEGSVLVLVSGKGLERVVRAVEVPSKEVGASYGEAARVSVAMSVSSTSSRPGARAQHTHVVPMPVIGLGAQAASPSTTTRP